MTKARDNAEHLKSAFLDLLEDQQSTINKLKESEKFNRLLFDKSPIGIVISRFDGSFVDANNAFVKLLGCDISEISTSSIWDLTPEKYHDIDKIQLEKLKIDGSYGPYEKELIRKNGSQIAVKISGVLIKKENEGLILSNVEDITKQKQDEKLLVEKESLFRSLFENSTIGFYRTTPDGKILLANPTLVSMLGYKTFKEFSLRNLEMDDYEPSYRRKEYKKQIEADGEIKGWEDTWLRKDGTEIYIRESARTVRDESGEILYYEGTVEDITESKIAVKALRDSEEIYRTIFATVGDAIFITDMTDGKIFACNERLGGYKITDLVGRTTVELKLWEKDEDRKRIVEIVKAQGSAYDFEANFRKKDGSIFVGSISVNQISIMDEKYLLSVIRDISERKKDEQKLVQSEEKFRSAFLTSPDSININRLSDGMYISINKGFTQITGYTEEDVIGKTSVEINIWADQESRKELIDGLAQYGEVKNLEARFRMKNGSIVYGLMSATILQLNGVDHILNITRDITERKIAEQKQWELREELHTTLYSIGDAVISSDKNGLVRQMNPIAEQLTGWTELEARGKNLTEVFNIICEDDRVTVENPVNRVLKEGAIIGLANHTILISKNGSERPIADSGAPIRDKEGNITGVVLVFRDQTEERLAQETLRRSEERMRAIVEGTPNLFFYTQDINANTTYVSQTVEKITGYTREQWINERSWFITNSPMNKDAIKKTYDHLNGDFSQNTISLEVKHASGSKIVLEIFEYPIMQNGKIIGLQGVAHDVTRQKLAEEELQKTNDTLNTIIHSSPLAIVALDLEGIVTLWNPAAERIFGWTSIEAVGKFMPTIIEGQKEEYSEILRKIIKNSITNYEVIRRKKDGSLIDISVSSVLLHDQTGAVTGVLSLHADITSRKRYEESLKKLYQATEQSPVSIIITDVNGNIEYVNPNLSLVSGYSFNEVVGKNPRIFKSGLKTETEYKEMWDTILEGNQWKGEFSNKKKDGSIYWESASISPIRNDDGKITHFIAVKEDITAKKKILEELILAKTKAEEANKTKDLFLANMSHELRTPLIGILGYSDLLTETLKEGENVEMAKGIKRSGKRLLNTLNMILNFTKIESEKYEITLKPINIYDELESVHKMFLGAAIDKNLEFKLEINSSDLVIDVDSALLAVILENLINNAVKFTMKGSIRLIAGKEKEGGIFIKVEDTGIGIEEHYFDAIFQEFRQVSEGINREFQGTGLGLSIAKKYIEMMNGKIEVNSKFGIGTAFTIHFPVSKLKK